MTSTAAKTVIKLLVRNDKGDLHEARHAFHSKVYHQLLPIGPCQLPEAHCLACCKTPGDYYCQRMSADQMSRLRFYGYSKLTCRKFH